MLTMYLVSNLQAYNYRKRTDGVNYASVKTVPPLHQYFVSFQNQQKM